MTVRHYSHLDAGAPILSGDLYARVRLVLMACLVNGYGTKPPAGWAVEHEVTAGFSLSNGDGVISFVRSGANGYQAYIMESISDGSSALPLGVNRRSADWYDGAATSNRQSFYSQATGFVSATPCWSVVADGKTCIINFAGGTSGGATVSGSAEGAAHYFGQYINGLGLTGPAAFCSLGGWYGVGNGQAFGIASNRFGMALRNPFNGLIDQGAARYGASSITYSREPVSISLVGRVLTATLTDPGRIQPIRAGVMCYGATLTGSASAATALAAGYLRGVISDPLLCGFTLSNVAALLGVPDTRATWVGPIAVPGGRQWVPLFPNNQDSGFFVSLDPADWE